MIYFIQQGEVGPIKIGVADSPDRRLGWLQCGNPQKLYLRAILVGGMPEERILHDRFASGHIRGEWFAAATPGLAGLIAAAEHEEFWSDDEDELLCARCQGRPVPLGRRKYCEACAR